MLGNGTARWSGLAAMSTGIETAVVRPADEATVLSCNFANPAQWQAFVKQMLTLEARVKALESEVAALKARPSSKE